MPNDNAIKFGLLKCRDLVELYYGARMVASIVETQIPAAANTLFQLLAPDPRRIAYELIFANGVNAINQFQIGSPQTDAPGNQQFYSIPPGGTLIIKRNFLEDLDAVGIELGCKIFGAAITVSTRETFLTPIPVDEMP